MTFANDPAVLRVAAALECERAAAARVVRKLLDVAEAASPWFDGEDIGVTTGYQGDAGRLEPALRRSRLVVDGEGGLVLVAGEAARLGELLREERAAAAEKKRLHRESAIHAAVAGHRGDNRGTTGGPLVDEPGTTGGRPGDDRGTSGTSSETIEGQPGTGIGTNGDIAGFATPITRAPGEGAGTRGNLLPPTPPATSDASPSSATIHDLPDPEDWLHEIAKRRGWRLDRVQRRELIGHMEAGMSPDFLEALLNQAADNDQRRMVWIRPALRREMERLMDRSPPVVEVLEFEQGGICHEAREDDQDRSEEGQVPEMRCRAGEDVLGCSQQAAGVVPPGAASTGDGCVLPAAGRRGLSDPIPLEEARLIREHKAGEPPGGMYEW